MPDPNHLIWPWAKLHRDCRQQRGSACRASCSCHVKNSLSLIGHSADVAAVLRALLERPVIGNRLARLLGKDVLTPQHQERLTALAALHDLGKISQGFQNAPFRVVSGSRGHVKPLVSLIQNERCDPKVDKALAALITSGGLAGLAHLLESPDGLPLARLPMQRFCVVLAHHGSLPGAQPGDAQLWRAARGYDPVGACRDLVDAIQTWLGSAVDPAPLDWTYNFGHAFAGLVTLERFHADCP